MIYSILVCTTAQIFKMYSLWVHFEYLCCCAYWNWTYHTQYRHHALRSDCWWRKTVTV